MDLVIYLAAKLVRIQRQGLRTNLKQVDLGAKRWLFIFLDAAVPTKNKM